MKSIIRLSEAASIALHASTYMASNEGVPLSVKQMGTKLGISRNHLAKVLQRLVAAGIAKSIQGPKGGYTLNKPAAQISFLDIIDHFDSRSCNNGCLFGREDCGLQVCIMGDFLQEITKRTMEYFAGRKLSEFENWHKTAR